MLKINEFIKFNRRINNSTNPKKNKLTIKKTILLSILILAISFTWIIIIIIIYLNKINRVDLNKNNPNRNTTITAHQNSNMRDEDNRLTQNNDIKNIALFGIDETEGTVGRSDCIMVLTIDNKHNELKLSSIIRDSYVVIPNKDKKDKINHAYAFGGPKLALETLNENFNLNIDKFISVNFSSLPKIVDDVGGITLDISDDELKYINRYIHNLNEINATNSPYITTSGSQLVDGTQALAYCRIRYTDGGDFERSQRHRTVLNQLFQKSKALPLTQYPSLFNKIFPIIYTNLEPSDIFSLIKNLNSLKNQPLLQDRFPYNDDASGKLIDGIYYYVFDEASTAKKINYFIFDE